MKSNNNPTKMNVKYVMNKNSLWTKAMMILLICCMVLNSPTMYKVTKADTLNQVNIRVDYVEELAYITAGSGQSTKFYFSTDNQKTWECLENSILDLSSLLVAKDTTIYFKGNKDTTSVPYLLQGEDKSLVVSYKITAGQGRIEFTSVYPVEYRKGPNGVWKTAINQMSTSIYETKGTTLYFRTVASVGKRSGKVVMVKIPKKPVAPSVKFDGSKLSITGLKSGETQFRVGDSSVWTTFTSFDTAIKTLDISSLLGGSTTTNSIIPAGTIEFRSLGSDKKVNSAVRVIAIPQQPAITPSAIYLSGTTISILDTNTKTQYEYTTVTKGALLNLNTAKWTSITSARPTIVKNVSINDRILVRLKSITDTTTKLTVPASTYVELPVTSITFK